MVKFSKLKIKASRQLLFSVLTVFLFVAMVALVVYNFVFLISNFGKVFVGDDRQNPPRGFDIEGFERLNLIRK